MMPVSSLFDFWRLHLLDRIFFFYRYFVVSVVVRVLAVRRCCRRRRRHGSHLHSSFLLMLMHALEIVPFGTSLYLLPTSEICDGLEARWRGGIFRLAGRPGLARTYALVSPSTWRQRVAFLVLHECFVGPWAVLMNLCRFPTDHHAMAWTTATSGPQYAPVSRGR